MQNRKIEIVPEFDEMKNELMKTSPGQSAVIFGEEIPESRLSLDEFLSILGKGLSRNDYVDLGYFYQKLARELMTEESVLSYDRFGTPFLRLKGDNIPEVKTLVYLGFLYGELMVPQVKLYTNDLTLPQWTEREFKVCGKSIDDRIEAGCMPFVLKGREVQDKSFDGLARELAWELPLEEVKYWKTYSGGPQQYTEHEENLMRIYRNMHYGYGVNVYRNFDDIIKQTIEHAILLNEAVTAAKAKFKDFIFSERMLIE